MDIKGKKITVVGLGRSGFSAAGLLADLGAGVSVTEADDSDDIKNKVRHLRDRGVAVEVGGHTRDFIKNRDLVVVSPGVNFNAAPILWAEEEKTTIISETELASSLCRAPIVAITGTNGKTTVATLTAEVLKRAGKKVFLCGNIGNPLSGEVAKIAEDDIVVLEVSSFQLERTIEFKPKVSVILNVTIDHLDRHRNFDEYLRTKAKIFVNQDREDWTVLNYNDSCVKKLADETKARVVFFRENEVPDFDQNHLAVMAIGSLFAVDEIEVRKVFATFKGVEHRLEYVTTIDGIKFINDSKATNVESTRWALRRSTRPIVLIAGGQDKGSDFTLVRDLVREKVKRLILVGSATQKISSALMGAVPIEAAHTIEEAVHLAHRAAEQGDCVLLSPMCASFDMFKNFEERGRTFKEAVRKIRISPTCRTGRDFVPR